MKNSHFRGNIRQWLEFLEMTLFRGVYMWIVRSENGKEFERVAYILVVHPLMVDDIEVSLDFGDWRGAVMIVADALSYKWNLPSYRTEEGKVRDIWKRSRLIRIFDYYPERVDWRISSYVKQLGLDKVAVSLEKRVWRFSLFVKQLGEDSLPILLI